MLTDDEREALRECSHLVEQVIIDPRGGVSRLRESRASGGGSGLNYEIRDNRLCVSWSRYEVLEHIDGHPSKLRFDPPHRTVSITLPRLRRWAEQLPDEVRLKCRRVWIAWRASATDDNATVWRQTVLDAINHQAVEKQLDLFEVSA